MTCIRHVVLIVLVLTVTTGDGYCADKKPKLFELARTLQTLQDRIVQGSVAALESQAQILDAMAQAIAAMDAAEWKDTRSIRALALYLLSGGTPRPVQELFTKRTDLGAMQPLLLALLAYAERKPDAAQQLARHDAQALDASLAGHVALAQAILTDAAPERSLASLGVARLLAPGALVEEAALRRQVRLLLAGKRNIEAVQIATRYLWRFPGSVYTPEVVAFLAGSVLPDMAAEPAGRGEVVRIVDELPTQQRGGLLLDMARLALLNGKLDVTTFAAKVVADVTESTDPLSIRARAYSGIASALAPASPQDAAQLGRIDRTRLADADRGVLDAAISLAVQIRAPTRLVASTTGEPSPAMTSARDAINRADTSLTETQP